MTRRRIPAVLVVLVAGIAHPGDGRAAPFAYVAEPTLNRVRVIDAGAVPPAIVATIAVGATPQGVAVHPGRSRAYVANSGGGSGTVSVISTISNAVVATVPNVGATPLGVAVNPAGTLVYVACAGQGDVAVIDTATNAVSSRIAIGGDPFYVAVNTSGTRLYVAVPQLDQVAVVDTATNQVIATIPVGSAPWAVAINPAANLGYTANFDDDTVSVFRTDTNTPVTNVPIGGSGGIEHGMSVAVHPAGTRVYAGIDYGPAPGVWVINAALNQVANTVTLGSGGDFEANSMAVDPSGSRLYVTTGQPGAGAFWVVDTGTDAVITSLSGLAEWARGLGHFITGCSTDAVCNDGAVCTTDACVDHVCVHSCADGVPCGAGCADLVCTTAGGGCACTMP